jgi:ABC-2 type transport system ATP-binding protein
MIIVEDVTRTYGNLTAVDDVSFIAHAGRVTGFLGPNGAGKSTTMRIMVGLTRATSGRVTIAGRAYADLPNPGLEVGVLLDASAQHAGRTGREILTIAQQYMGLPRNRVERCWSRQPHTRRGVPTGRQLLAGMRQRLGIATALIGDPEVLILDEPANGLDPAGIRWMRDLLRGYADRGGTVLLSSHLLHEIEVIADDIVMIGNGRIVSQGTKTELLHAAGTVVRAADLDNLQRALGELGIATSQSEDGALRTDVDPTLVGKVALEAGVALTELRAADAGLEDMFLELTATSQREGAGHDRHRSRERSPTAPRDPSGALTRVTQVELRKMFNTRSGFWLIASIAISAVLATGGVILWAPGDQLTYSTFATAIRFPWWSSCR